MPIIFYFLGKSKYIERPNQGQQQGWTKYFSIVGNGLDEIKSETRKCSNIASINGLIFIYLSGWRLRLDEGVFRRVKEPVCNNELGKLCRPQPSCSYGRPVFGLGTGQK